MQLNWDEYIEEQAANIEFIEQKLDPSVKLYIKREDRVHPHLSGNKWRKLKYNLIEAKLQNCIGLVTFGGAYSNHIFAVASAGNIFNFATVGIIRGEEYSPLNHTLKFASSMGMKLNYLPRSIYRLRNSPEFQNKVKSQFPDHYLIPEGGTNHLAVKGIAEMMKGVGDHYDYIISAIGSGGTAAGIISKLNDNQIYIGIPVMKNGSYMKDIIEDLVDDKSKIKRFIINPDYHLGGFAKINRELIQFKSYFENNFRIPLDPIYTSKTMFAVFNLIRNKYFKKNSKVLVIHTGGLQGNIGMKEKMEKYLN